METFPKSRTLTFSSESSQSELMFFQGLMKNLMDQRSSGELCDIVIKVKCDKMHYHKSILGANSPYFYSMFTSDFGEKASDEIDLSAIFSSFEPLQAIFDFMYTGQLKLDEDILEEVLNGATLFLMDSVRSHCAHYMLVNLGMHNALAAWELAERFSLRTLAKICQTVSTEHIRTCASRVLDIQSLSVNLLELLLSESKTLNQRSEMCSVISEWAKNDPARISQLKGCIEKGSARICDASAFLAALDKSSLPVPVDETKSSSPAAGKEHMETPATKEHVVFHKVEETSQGHCVMKIFAHSGEVDSSWTKLAELNLDPHVAHSLTHIIGFLGQKAVLGSVDGGKAKLFDLRTGESSTVSFLEEDGVNDIRRTILYSCFCFDNRLFCIEKNKNNYFFRCAYTLKQYNPALSMWSLVAELPLTDMEQRDEVEFQVGLLFMTLFFCKKNCNCAE